MLLVLLSLMTYLRYGAKKGAPAHG
jgi:hypothetical protein